MRNSFYAFSAANTLQKHRSVRQVLERNNRLKNEERRQRPLNCGLRFSLKASTPSCRSSVEIMRS